MKSPGVGGPGWHLGGAQQTERSLHGHVLSRARRAFWGEAPRARWVRTVYTRGGGRSGGPGAEIKLAPLLGEGSQQPRQPCRRKGQLGPLPWAPLGCLGGFTGTSLRPSRHRKGTVAFLGTCIGEEGKRDRARWKPPDPPFTTSGSRAEGQREEKSPILRSSAEEEPSTHDNSHIYTPALTLAGISPRPTSVSLPSGPSRVVLCGAPGLENPGRPPSCPGH